MKTKRSLLSIFSVIGLLVGLSLSGCVAAIGNDTGPLRRQGTLGQELIDLQKAKEAGAMTEEEYTAQKAKLLGERKS